MSTAQPLRARAAGGGERVRLLLHGTLACTLLLAQPASARLHHRHDPIQCCHTRASGVTKCRVKTPRACRRRGGTDMGPGTCHPNPCGAPATLPTSTTTTTIPGGQRVHLLVQPMAAPTACGGPGYGTVAASPFSGEVDDGTGTKVADLQLGCVYEGGAAPGQPGGGTPVTNRVYTGGRMLIDVEPDEGTQVTLSASDDPGPLGCTRGAGPAGQCLGPASTGSQCMTDVDCGGTPGSCQADARCYTTEPIDYTATGVSGFVVCLVDIVEHDVSGSADIATGETSLTLPLASRVYLSACPKCVAGQCNGGKNAGDSCTTSEGGGTSVSCLPLDGSYFGVIETKFTSTTGSSELPSDSAGVFCSGQPYPGAFGLADARKVVEQGSPAGDLRDSAPHDYTGAITGCVPPSSNTTINQSGGLPFPLAVATQGTMQLR
jgi:hypothetical protein